MELIKTQKDETMTIELVGRLDTTTAPQLEKEIQELPTTVTELTLDFGQLEYISSAGLRVLLATQKRMNTQGSLKLTHVNNDVLEIFDITGFSDILTIEA